MHSGVTDIFYLGDYDPSGVDIYQQIGEDLREFAPNASMMLNRVAVTPRQIRAWDLPSRPTKKSDSRAKGFTAESVELDTILPEQLRQIVVDRISQIVDRGELQRTFDIERLERKSIPDIIAGLHYRKQRGCNEREDVIVSYELRRLLNKEIVEQGTCVK